MPTFFIPTLQDEAKSLKLLKLIVARINSFDAAVSDTPLFAVRCFIEGQFFEFRVGERSDYLGEVVVAILHPTGRNEPYYVCTVNHGAVRGFPFPIQREQCKVAYSFTFDLKT